MSDYGTVNGVDLRPIDLEPIHAGQLDTLGNGLYRMRGRVKVADFYNAAEDKFEKNVEQVLCVRIDDGKELPGTGKCRIRTDGKRVMVGWVRA